MIKAMIILNDQGKPRLVKFYNFQAVEKQQELIRSIYGVLCSRANNVSNFIRVDSLFGPDVRLVYKTFATLYFVFVFDSSENELAILDLMQVFVETLDKFFLNVCELDIVFNFNKVHAILDEIILGGQVLETNSLEVVKALERWTGRKSSTYGGTCCHQRHKFVVLLIEDGSSEVYLGQTHVMGCVTAELVQPYRDRPNEGTLSIFTEFSPMADPSFEAGRPGESAIELGQIVDRGLRESRAVDTKSLCVVSGKFVWSM